jgi:hypothetical protein
VTIGRVSVDGAAKGIGFAIGPRLALTARHVVIEALDESDHQKPGCKLKLLAPDGATYDAEIQTCSRRLDIAALNLASDVATWLRAAQPQDGVQWRVDSRPRDDDPMLTGQVTTSARQLVTEAGEEAVLMQLQVQQSLGDYGGYSGSPIECLTPEGEPQGLVGILIEQGRWRVNVPGIRLPPVSNVLYAVPITSVLEVLGIEPPVAADPELERYKERMRRLKTAAAEQQADPALIHEAEKEVLFRYVLGE